MHQVIGIQTLVTDPEVAYELAPATLRTLSSCSLLENTVSDNHSWTSDLWKLKSTAENLQHIARTKNNTGLNAEERVRKTILFYSHYLSPKVAQLSAKRNILGSIFLLVGK